MAADMVRIERVDIVRHAGGAATWAWSGPAG